MKKYVKRILALAMALCMLLGLMAGCSGKEAEVQEPTTGASAQSDTPVQGDVPAGPKELTIGMSTAWETLTPFRNMSAYGIAYARMLYDTLGYRLADGTIIPQVAKEWSVEDDGVTWNIEIYDYVTDSAGNKITAADIVWMINAQREAALKPCFNRVADVKQTGDYTLQVVLNQDMAGAIEAVLQHTFVVSQAAFEASEDEFVTNVVSTAPYKVVKFVSGSSLTLEKRADYWQKEELIHPTLATNLDKATFLYIPEASQQQIALETEEVDVFCSMDGSVLSAFQSNDQYVVAPSNYTVGNQLFFSGHESRPVANDVNLRLAIAYAIDEKGIIAGVYDGLAGTTYDIAPDTLLGYQASWKQEPYFEYDPELAKQYLAKSNYKGEELIIMANNSTRNSRMLTMIQAYLLEVGIKLKLNLVDRALYSASMNDGSTYDLVQVSAGGTEFPTFWANRLDSTSFPNGDATGRKDEKLTEMIKKTSTNAGFTPENINAIRDYVNENMYGYNICQPMIVDVYSASIGIAEASPFYAGGIDFIASTYN